MTERGWLLLTNDDGIEAPGFRMLVDVAEHAGRLMGARQAGITEDL